MSRRSTWKRNKHKHIHEQSQPLDLSRAEPAVMLPRLSFLSSFCSERRGDSITHQHFGLKPYLWQMERQSGTDYGSQGPWAPTALGPPSTKLASMFDSGHTTPSFCLSCLLTRTLEMWLTSLATKKHATNQTNLAYHNNIEIFITICKIPRTMHETKLTYAIILIVAH